MANVIRLPTSCPRRNRLTRRALKILHAQLDQLARERPSLVAVLARMVNDMAEPQTKGGV
jgi:hypothetical protein